MDKKKVKLIVAISENYAIGKNGGLIFTIKEDMKRFRQKTTGNVVIMGSRTFETLPNGPLPNRINYVVGSKNGKDDDNLIFVDSVEKAIDDATRNYPDKDIWVIGGGQIYKYCLDNGLIDEMHLTRFHKMVKDASTWFPRFDAMEWKKTEVEGYTENGLKMSFEVLVKEQEVNKC